MYIIWFKNDTSDAIKGAGDTKTPFNINLICFWGSEIPFAYFLARVVAFNHYGIFSSITIAKTLMTILAFWVFKRGKRKLKEV